jgi:hypothetical protein
MKRLICLILVICTSCNLVVDVHVPENNANQLVTNAIQSPESVWTVELSLSEYVLTYGNYKPVNSATIVIEGTDGTTETLEPAYVPPQNPFGRFTGKSKPKPGQTYKITTVAEGHAPVTAEMTMPNVVPLIDVKWDSAATDHSPYGNYAGYAPLNITFEDPAGDRNFYQLEISFTYTYDEGTADPDVFIKDTLTYSGQIFNIDPAVASKDNGRARFGDDTFDGKRYTATCVARKIIDIYSDARLLWIDVKLTSITEGWYKYQETAELSNSVGGDPFAQPVPVYSNMSNNFGIFGGAVSDSRRFYQKKQP